MCIACFLPAQENLIYCLIINILHKIFLVLLVQVIVKFVKSLFTDVFLIPTVTFLEGFCLICNQISSLGV